MFKLKLAFWLDRPLLGGEVKRWMVAEQAPVDPAVFGAVQLIYLARPRFGHGLHDPVPRRTGLWHGETDTVAVPESCPSPRCTATRAAGGKPAPAEGLEELCEQLRERLQVSFRCEQPPAQAAFAYFHQHGADVEQKPIYSTRAEHRNHVWSYDFVEDRTHEGGKVVSRGWWKLVEAA